MDMAKRERNEQRTSRVGVSMDGMERAGIKRGRDFMGKGRVDMET